MKVTLTNKLQNAKEVQIFKKCFTRYSLTFKEIKFAQNEYFKTLIPCKTGGLVPHGVFCTVIKNLVSISLVQRNQHQCHRRSPGPQGSPGLPDLQKGGLGLALGSGLQGEDKEVAPSSGCHFESVPAEIGLLWRKIGNSLSYLMFETMGGEKQELFPYFT